jgi:hypothetical protein
MAHGSNTLAFLGSKAKEERKGWDCIGIWNKWDTLSLMRYGNDILSREVFSFLLCTRRIWRGDKACSILYVLVLRLDGAL